MHAPLHRCLAVGGALAAVAVALVVWLLPIAFAPAPGLDGALVRICAAVAAVSAAWLGAVGAAVSLEAIGTGVRLPGVPGSVRRVILATCGVAVAAGLTAPAGATTGGHDGPQTAVDVVASAIAGLPLPDRPHGGPHRGTQARPGDAPPARVLTVRPGDTLWELAERHLGDGSRWTELYAANRAVVGADPDLIRPAERLRIPGHPKETR